MSQANPMMAPKIAKVCVNIGVGEGGDRLVNAENVLEMVTGVKPQRTLGKIQNRDLKVRVVHQLVARQRLEILRRSNNS